MENALVRANIQTAGGSDLNIVSLDWARRGFSTAILVNESSQVSIACSVDDR